jgi:hypothetical protein
MLKPDDLEGMMFSNFRIGNMGYVQDPGGDQDGRRKGYSYSFRCVDHPRLVFRDDTYLLDDGGWRRVWIVDGEECPDLPAALERLAQPPLLSASEFVAWMRLPPDPVPYWLAAQWIAGMINPDPHFLDRDTRFGRCDHALAKLFEKGMVAYDVHGMIVRA